MEKHILEEVIDKLGTGNGEESLKASKQLIYSSDDSDLRNILTVKMTELLNCKDSLSQDKWLIDITNFVKDQLSLIYLQAFRSGRTYQLKVYQELINNIPSSSDSVDDSVESETTQDQNIEKV